MEQGPHSELPVSGDGQPEGLSLQSERLHKRLASHHSNQVGNNNGQPVDLESLSREGDVV